MAASSGNRGVSPHPDLLPRREESTAGWASEMRLICAQNAIAVSLKPGNISSAYSGNGLGGDRAAFRHVDLNAIPVSSGRKCSTGNQPLFACESGVALRFPPQSMMRSVYQPSWIFQRLQFYMEHFNQSISNELRVLTECDLFGSWLRFGSMTGCSNLPSPKPGQNTKNPRGPSLWRFQTTLARTSDAGKAAEGRRTPRRWRVCQRASDCAKRFGGRDGALGRRDISRRGGKRRHVAAVHTSALLLAKNLCVLCG